VAIEVETNRSPGFGDANGLNAFLSTIRIAQVGCCYMGGGNRRLGERILPRPGRW